MSIEKILKLEELKNSIDLLKKIYDFVRIIKPIEKQVYDLDTDLLIETPHKCHDLWRNGKICSNCISMRAYNEKDTFFKLEGMNDRIFMILAVPVQDSAETFILELIKDITRSMALAPPANLNHPLLSTLCEIGQQQIHDSLTGLFNRRFIDERLPPDLLHSQMTATSFAVIFADIDKFKTVNDTFGHIAGDHVLKGFAEILQAGVDGKNGWAARYGGEEFLVCLKGESAASLKDFTETLRKQIEYHVFNAAGKSIRITSSFGVCLLCKSWNVTAEEFIDLADKNLYKAKSDGRNQVVLTET
ncbi:MAG: GGDEF domain-containing protein [Clostridia bacterium]|nr:GGDEF domain-containing protein [Clostridia bacterium]